MRNNELEADWRRTEEEGWRVSLVVGEDMRENRKVSLREEFSLQHRRGPIPAHRKEGGGPVDCCQHGGSLVDLAILDNFGDSR